jgi:hypothetical protein
MGIGSSKNEINKIASEYIIHLNTSDMKQLIDKDGYKNILKLVNTIICKNINNENINLLYKDLYWGHSKYNNNENKEKCIKISHFYVNVAHLFSSIIMTINPHKRFFKDSIDKENDDNKTHDMSLCSNRLHLLIEKSMKDNNLTGKDGYFSELETLYYDKYDFKSNKFNKMTFTMKKKYERDVNTIYKSFTGKNIPSKNRKKLYKKFSHIKLSDILNIHNNVINNNNENQKHDDDNDNDNDNNNDNDKIKEGYEITRLYKAYADNIKIMITYIYIQEKELIKIINKLFKQVNRTYVINDINMNDLDKLISETQIIITKMNSKCDDFYVKGIQIYDAIVQSQIKYTTIKQIENSEKIMEKLHNNDYSDSDSDSDSESESDNE